MTDRPSESAPARVRIREINVGQATLQRVKEWLDAGRVEQLANAYHTIENFRVRRQVVEKFAATEGAMGVACLVRALERERDANLEGEIRKKLLARDAKTVVAHLDYEPTADGRLAVVAMFAALKSPECVQPLRSALRDKEGEVRIAAIEGLTAALGSSEEWLKQLGKLAVADPDPTVRLAVAKAFETVDTREAFDAFELASKERGFDPQLLPALKRMRADHGMGRTKRIREAAEKDAAARKGPLGSLTPKELAIAGGVVLFLLLVGAFLLAKVSTATRPQVPYAGLTPAPVEVQQANQDRFLQEAAAEMKRLGIGQETK